MWTLPPFSNKYVRIRNGYGFIENQIEEKAETTLQPASEAAVVNEDGAWAACAQSVMHVGVGNVSRRVDSPAFMISCRCEGVRCPKQSLVSWTLLSRSFIRLSGDCFVEKITLFATTYYYFAFSKFNADDFSKIFSSTIQRS
jgi:hypothetical protein